MALTPPQRSLRGKLAANTRWSRDPDPAATGRRGQAGLLARFEAQVDPDGTLDPAERARRAAHARTAYMQGLALRSSKARAARKQGGGDATP